MKTVMVFAGFCHQIVEFASFDVTKTFQWKRRGLHDEPGHPVRRRETLPAQWLQGEEQIFGVFFRSVTV